MKRTTGRGNHASTKAAIIERNGSNSLKVQENQSIRRNKAIEAEKAGYPKMDIICRRTMPSGEAALTCLKAGIPDFPGIVGDGCSRREECMNKWIDHYYKPPKFKRSYKPRVRRRKNGNERSHSSIN